MAPRLLSGAALSVSEYNWAEKDIFQIPYEIF